MAAKKVKRKGRQAAEQMSRETLEEKKLRCEAENIKRQKIEAVIREIMIIIWTAAWTAASYRMIFVEVNKYLAPIAVAFAVGFWILLIKSIFEFSAFSS